MNRAERRRQDKEHAKKATYTLTKEQLQAIKQEATTEAAETAFLLMLGIPILVFKDHFGQLIRREVDEKSREQRFMDYCLKFYQQFERGLYSL